MPLDKLSLSACITLSTPWLMVIPYMCLRC
jgi:hypothetical protein